MGTVRVVLAPPTRLRRTASRLHPNFVPIPVVAGASLLLTRICAFLKTRVHGGEAAIGMALQALSVFLGAASGHRFLLEFLDTGGLQMTIQMIKTSKIAETDRIRALQLLASIANSGYTYKQMICNDFQGEDVVLTLMCEAQSESAHELIRSVLIGLGRGNRNVAEMQSKLIACLRNDQALVQRTASQVLRQVFFRIPRDCLPYLS